MDNPYANFQEKSMPKIPKEHRQVDWTYIDALDKPFSEGEKMLHQLREDYHDMFADQPFAYLNFLRSIESHLLGLAIDKKQPIPKCLKYLCQRLSLEYNRSGIPGKVAEITVLANYAIECGETELAKSLLTEEKEQLEEVVNLSQCNLEFVVKRLAELNGENKEGK